MYAEQLRDAFHYMYRDEVPALKILARQLRVTGPTVINIGAGAGTSGLALMESRPDLYLVTIDIQADDSPFGCLVAEKQELQKAGLWGHRNHQIHGDSVTVGATWGHGLVNMVFVDGGHSYAECKADIDTWLPLIWPGGIIAVHDYKKHLIPETPDGPHPMDWPGVDQAVKECLLAVGYPVIMYVDSLIAFRV